jgi:voltage-gated potassium channel
VTRARRSATERERFAHEIGHRLDPIMTELGLAQLLVWLIDNHCVTSTRVHGALEIAFWVIYAVFAIEFAARLVAYPSTSRFLKTHWWQVPMLVFPFLRFIRLIRLARIGRVVSSAVRGTRSAARTLASRLTWLISAHVFVVFFGAYLLCEFGGYADLLASLHDAALAAATGEPVRSRTGFAQTLEVILAMWGVGVFGALAGTFGAFLLEPRVGRDALATLRDTLEPDAPSIAPGAQDDAP